jgi:hypothetical protein
VTRTLPLVALALVAAACGHEGKSLSGVQRVAPPGQVSAQPHAADPHGHGQAEAAPADPHAGMPPAAVAAAPAASSAAPVAWTVPAGWTESPPANKMRITQFDVAPGVQCVLFPAMGPDEPNVERWIGQMGEGAEKNAKSATSETGGVKVRRLEVRGQFTDTMRPGETKAVDAATMLAAIIEGPAGKYHVKLVGPSDVVDANAAKFDAFVGSIRAK